MDLAWADITFDFDQQNIITPITFFKDYEVVFKELATKNFRRPSYDVFYSNNPSDTPEKVMKREKKIVSQDGVRYCIRGGKKAEPQAGWYKAKLNMWDGGLKLNSD